MPETTPSDETPTTQRTPPVLVRRLARVRTDVGFALVDVLLVAMSYSAALLLRFDFAVPQMYRDVFLLFLPLAIGVHLLASAAFGLYGEMWHHASVAEARRVCGAAAAASSFLLLIDLVPSVRVPLSVVLVGGALALLAIGALRFRSRLFAQNRRMLHVHPTRIAVVGAGEAGARVVREMRTTPAAGLEPVVLIDDASAKHHRFLYGVPVAGPLAALADICKEHRVERVLLAMPSASPELIRNVAELCDGAGLPLQTLPRIEEIVGGSVGIQDVRDLRIEDLLGRDQVPTDLDAVRGFLTGRRVLITGAGGSIGSEIARQVAACDPASLLLLDHDETHLHDVSASIELPHTLLLADLREVETLRSLFATHRPEVVFHAAAHKHVPILEAFPSEAVLTNVVGTEHLIEQCTSFGVDRLVFISTDKAVRPKSVMGASKRLGEQLLLTRTPESARWCAVRFGNVLGSRGSVIPTFQRQIAGGGPVTVTDRNMTRFFMSIPEAVQLVLQAAALSDGRDIFMLDMGEPVNIYEMAERMIRLSGRTPGRDVEIKITGLRPGEKLAEELRAPGESPLATSHPSIVRLCPQRLPDLVLASAVGELAQAARRKDEAAVRGLLFAVAGDDGVIDLTALEPSGTAPAPGTIDADA